jgi:hypothetical protein
MSKTEVERLGWHWKSACRFKYQTYRYAEAIAGYPLAVTADGAVHLAEIESLSDLAAGVLLLQGWGVVVPPEFSTAANLAPSINSPGSTSIN